MPLNILGGGGGGGASTSGGMGPEALERTGRRLMMLQSYTPELVNASPEGALALAEGGGDDDQLLRSATESEDFASIRKLQENLLEEDDDVQRATWGQLPEPLTDALRDMGYEPPEAGGSGRLFGSIPVLGEIAEKALDWGEIPGIGGALEEVQHGLGEVAEETGVGDFTKRTLGALDVVGDFFPHTYRSLKHVEQEQGGGLGYFNPSQLSRAWSSTYRDDGYVRPSHRNRARRTVGGNQRLYDIAHGLATGKSPDEIIEDAGYEPDSPEAVRMGLEIVEAQGNPDVQEAMHELSVGQVSFGRSIANAMGLEDTDNGWGRNISGLVDAGASFIDPTLVAGRASKGLRFGRHAFRLEEAGDVNRLTRVANIALDGVRNREGLRPVAEVGNVRPWEMRRARAVTAWGDRVSEGFRTGELARLSREMPSTATALDTMQRAHLRRVANGEAGLDTTRGALEWLKDRDGILAITGTRLSGASPMQRGLRLPALTNTQRGALYAKGLMQRKIDWARGLEAPQVREIVSALGRPRELVRQLGEFGVAHTVGAAGRLASGLTSHVPYGDAIHLYGNKAVEEFSRLTNLGMFANMSRSTMDEYIDGFAKGDFVVRSNMVEQFLEHLFRGSGIGDTEFARRFVGRHRQAYAPSPGDLVDAGGFDSHAARLVDGHHADMMSVPNTREFLRESRRDNLQRWLFHNTPASWTDARLGRTWKPLILMRLGFIPRAAGEEMLHFVLKHGGRTYLGAKGAEWMVNAEFAPDVRARLTEAEELGQVDEANRLTRELADLDGSSAVAPLRSLMSFWDRAATRLLSTDAVEHAPWRQRWIERAHNLDERGVVGGLENFANQLSLRASGAIETIAEKAHLPSKEEVGRIMAERWDPGAAEAARLLVTDPRAARAFSEEISGSTQTPMEFRRAVDENGAPIPKIQISERQFGVPVLREVDLRPAPGQYGTHRLSGAGQSWNSYYNSIYARHRAFIRGGPTGEGDRVSRRVIENTLPRWVGSWEGDLSRRLGYSDAESLRGDLNQLWAHAPEEEVEDAVTGGGLLGAARKIIDKDADEGLKVWFGQHVDEVSSELGLNLDGRRLREALEDDSLDNAAQRWTLYQNVDETRLIRDWRTLENQVRHTARGRLSRPDMYQRLREMRLYAGDERLAQPTADGISKVYVPLVGEQVDLLGDDFVDAAKRRIHMIGGYSDDQAERIARNVQAGVERGREAIPDMGGRIPLSAWGASDPRVADAIMGAADEIAGTRSTFGILEVPDEVVQTAAGDRAMGLRTQAEHWEVADDYEVEPWRLMHTKPTAQQRRISQLEIGDNEWWDDVELDAATVAYRTVRPGTTRRFSTDHRTWTDEAPDEPFWYVDLPEEVASRHAELIPDEIVSEYQARRLPGVPDDAGSWPVRAREVGDGLGEIEALERVANSSTDEVFETLTTLKRQELDDDVLHEIVEPLLRPDRVLTDEAGNKVIEHGYTWDHLVEGTPLDRLPRETYGPQMVGSSEVTFPRIVQDWFEGPVDHALSSVIRKPMFLHNFGEQLRNSRGLADLFVDDDIAQAVTASGLDQEQLDNLSLALKEGDGDEAILEAYRVVSGDDTADLADNDLQALRRFAQQRNHGLDLVRMNSLNRAVQLTTPFIDDHRIRSAFQQYVGNFVPFQFAEEQFLKRWVKSVVESPEMIRRAQLAMNGLRNMGVVRKDSQGNEIFVYPLAGEAMQLLSEPLSWVFGEYGRLPYVSQMTGRVDYTLPGLGDQMGAPSVGPLVAMPLEWLSRRHPELAEIEQVVSGPGADRSLWNYFVPSWAGSVWESSFADVDKGQIASAHAQAISIAALNGDLPAENATAGEKQEFLERMESQARTIILARGLFGMVAPAAPQWNTQADQISSEFKQMLHTSGDFEAAVAALFKAHPDIEPADLLSTTVSETESEYPGRASPTDEAFDFIEANSDLLAGFPAAAPWLLPQGGENKFSRKAWAQQMARGMRKRKDPEELLNDMYYRQAAEDYYDERTNHDALLETAQGNDRAELMASWNAWKGAYLKQHPVFAEMQEDPTRRQRRIQAIDELTTLSAGEDSIVAPELRELVNDFADYRQSVEGLRLLGDRRQVVTQHRAALTEEFVTRAQWYIERHPQLKAFWTSILEPILRSLDEDAVLRGAA